MSNDICLLCQWFGPLPAWYGQWVNHLGSLRAARVVLITNEREFVSRVSHRMGFDCPPVSGNKKSGDFVPALGHLYEDLLDDCAWWGHLDIDVVLGRIDRYLTDEELSGIDLWSNDPYPQMCGPFSLYRNTPGVNRLYRDVSGWMDLLSSPEVQVFDENHFSSVVSCHGRSRHRFWQPVDPSDDSDVTLEPDGTLRQHGNQLFMFHFNRNKRWPITPKCS